MRIGSRLAAFVVTIGAALWFRNYWALVIGMVAQSSFYAIATYIAHPFRPRLSLKRRAELLGTSLWIFVHAVTQTVQMQIERLVMGRFSSTHIIGLYSVSKDLSEIFTQEIATALNRVTFVTVAESGELNEAPLRTAQILGAYAMIAAPMGFGLAATAEPSIHLLLGAKATAGFSGREFVTPDDIQSMVLPTLRHRIVLQPEASANGLTPDDVLTSILQRVPVPR